jgi:carboxypeptidase T
MLRPILLSLTILLFSSIVFAQKPLYHRAKIWTGESGMKKLSSLGIETDHGDHKKNVWFISDFSDSEISRIKDAGFRYEIIISDVSAYYRNQSATSLHSHKSQMSGGCGQGTPFYPVPSNFALGSYAGYFTYQEMLDNLDSMASKFPSLITVRAAIPGGSTIENRPVYYIKISDNPAVDETEPEVLYSAVHHAREPGGMSQLIYYMWYILENYSTDAEIAATLNNTELFFIPCLNPDGYMYNETTDPFGGGLWRKNRRDNLDGTFGVDLNRNYGYNWGFDDDGSSPDPISEVYRGTAPFSEPETQLMRDFVNSRGLRIVLNYHTYGNLLIYPWGYNYSIYTPDSALLSDYGNLLTTYNGYTYGTADQTVGYIVNGSSDDWMYGEQTSKPKIFAMTPECGDAAFGFWPPSNEIIPLCQSNMFQNITMAQLAGKYATLEETSPTLVATGGGHIKFTLKQLGLDTIGTYTISLTALTANIFQTGNNVILGNLSPMQQAFDSISFALTTPMTNGEEIKFLLSIDNGQYTRSDTVIKYFGTETVAFASNGNSTSGWNIGQWGISNSIFYSPTASITDSPVGDYNSNEFKTCRITNPVNLSNAVKATLSFYARWAIEPNFDYVQVQASTNNGATWTALCGKYTVAGSAYQIQDEPLYEGFQFSWVKEEISLDDYLGQNIQIRFTFTSDGGAEFDGFYFDDIFINKVLPGTNSIEETSTDANIITVTPNPASDFVYLSFNNAVLNGNIVVHDVTGRRISSQKIESGTTSVKLNLNAVRKGIYFVRYENNKVKSTPVKLVIN